MKKFKFIGMKAYDEDGNEITVNSYGGKQVKNGDTVELNDYFSDKAMNNPNYEEVKAKRGRKPEVKQEEVKQESE